MEQLVNLTTDRLRVGDIIKRYRTVEQKDDVDCNVQIDHIVLMSNKQGNKLYILSFNDVSFVDKEPYQMLFDVERESSIVNDLKNLELEK